METPGWCHRTFQSRDLKLNRKHTRVATLGSSSLTQAKNNMLSLFIRGVLLSLYEHTLKLPNKSNQISSAVTIPGSSSRPNCKRTHVRGLKDVQKALARATTKNSCLLFYYYYYYTCKVYRCILKTTCGRDTRHNTIDCAQRIKTFPHRIHRPAQHTAYPRPEREAINVPINRTCVFWNLE